MTSFELVKVVRDARAVKGAQRLLLDALVTRANTKQDYSCFPSYTKLMKDTQLKLTQLKVAARELENKGLIRRTYRARSSNRFHINVPMLVKLAAANRKADKEAREGEDAAKGPFDEAEITDAGPDIDNTDGLGFDEVEEDDEEIQHNYCETPDDVVALVGQLWPGHPTVTDSRSRDFLKKDLIECIRLADTEARCGQVLVLLNNTDGKAWESAAKSKKLGLYLARCFPGWLRKYANQLMPVGKG